MRNYLIILILLSIMRSECDQGPSMGQVYNLSTDITFSGYAAIHCSIDWSYSQLGGHAYVCPDCIDPLGVDGNSRYRKWPVNVTTLDADGDAYGTCSPAWVEYEVENMCPSHCNITNEGEYSHPPYCLTDDFGPITETITYTFPTINGCTNPEACNYNEVATDDDGSCEYPEDCFDCQEECICHTDCSGACGGYDYSCFTHPYDIIGTWSVYDNTLYENQNCSGDEIIYFCPDEVGFTNIDECNTYCDSGCITPTYSPDPNQTTLITFQSNGTLVIMGENPDCNDPWIVDVEVCNNELGCEWDNENCISNGELIQEDEEAYWGVNPDGCLLFWDIEDGEVELELSLLNCPSYHVEGLYLDIFTIDYGFGMEINLELQDCAGIWGGDSYIDNCGQCMCGVNGYQEGYECDDDDECEQGCDGEWYSNLNELPVVDCEDICNGIMLHDCNGDCGGSALLDECSVCSGGNTAFEYNEFLDCTGTCFGGAEYDFCGVCEGDNTSCEILGDINGDTIINIFDIILIVNLIMDNAYNPQADLNEDGSINVLDIINLVNLILYGPPEPEPLIMFAKTFGESQDENGKSVQQTIDGGYILIGNTKDYTSAPYFNNIWLIKTDSQGNEEWNQAFGGTDDDYGESVQQTIDGGYIAAGTTQSFGIGYCDIWLIKTDSQGNEEWNRTLNGGGESSDYVNSVRQTTDGGYIVLGHTFFDESYMIWLVKTDSLGNIVWDRVFGTIGPGPSYFDYGKSVKQTTDGGYILTGSTENGGDSDVCLIKTDSDGNEEWNHTFGGSYDEIGYSVQQTTDSGFIITGYTKSFGGGDPDLWLIKTDNAGNEQWDRIIGTEYSNDTGHSVQETSDGGFIIAGETASFGNGGHDVWLIKTDGEGNQQWNQKFGGTNHDRGNSVQQTTDGGFIITGETESYGNGNSDVWLIKTDSLGNTVPVE